MIKPRRQPITIGTVTAPRKRAEPLCTQNGRYRVELWRGSTLVRADMAMSVHGGAPAEHLIYDRDVWQLTGVNGSGTRQTVHIYTWVPSARIAPVQD